MKKHDEQLQDLYRDLSIPPPAADSKKQALCRAGETFEQEQKKNLKITQGSLSEDRFMTKIITTINKLLGGPDMTKRYALIGTAALAIMIGVTLHQQQNNLLTRPDGLTDILPDQKKTYPFKDEEVPGPVQQTKPAQPQDVSGKGKDLRQRVAVAELESSTPEQIGRQFKKDQKVLPEPVAAPSNRPAEEALQGLLQNKMMAADSTRPNAAPQKLEMVAPGMVLSNEPRFDYGSDLIGRDRFREFSVNSIKRVSEEPLSTFSIDVDTASYAFTRRALKNGILPQKNAVRIEELINYFDYDYAVPTDKSQPFEPTVGIYQTPWNPQTKIMHIGIKGYDIGAQEKPKTNLVFLVDVSGSMSSPDKLPLLKNSLRLLVDTLQEKDTVALVVYAGAAGVVLEPTSGSEKGKITMALEQLQAGGSTAGGAGIQLAYSLAEANFDKNGINRVILATDGDFNVGITNQEELKGFIEKKRQSGVSLSVLGFGQGNYNDSLMQDLAQNGNGNAAYIDTLSEARKVLVDEASSTLFTIAADVKIQVEFNPAMVEDYRLIGYETRALNKEDFNNDKVDAGDIGSGHSVTALYEITPFGSKDKLIDDLRYQQGEKPVPTTAPNKGEYGFIKLRYKLPGEAVSKLMTRPVDRSHEYGRVDNAPGEMRFAAAVAAFGQILRNDPFNKDFNYDEVISLANSGKGSDPYGYRSEFVNLVRLAKSARGM